MNAKRLADGYWVSSSNDYVALENTFQSARQTARAFVERTGQRHDIVRIQDGGRNRSVLESIGLGDLFVDERMGS